MLTETVEIGVTMKTKETAVLIETVEAGKTVETAVLTETVKTGVTM